MTGAATEAARVVLPDLDRLLAERSGDAHQVLTDATRAAVAIRDELIMRLREEPSARPLRERLQQANLLVSTAVGAQFPVTGLHWDRVEKTRDGLKRMIARE